MANTDLSYYANDVYIGGSFLLEWREAGAAGILPGYILTADTGDAAEIKVCATNSTSICGQAALKATQDIDTGYTSGDSFPLFHLGQGTHTWAKNDGGGSGALEIGQNVVRSDLTAGTLEYYQNQHTGGSANSYKESMELCVRTAKFVTIGSVAVWFQVILHR